MSHLTLLIHTLIPATCIAGFGQISGYPVAIKHHMSINRHAYLAAPTLKGPPLHLEVGCQYPVVLAARGSTYLYFLFKLFIKYVTLYIKYIYP